MANRTFLLCLLILCGSIYVSEGKWGRSGGRSSSSSRGGSSWGKGWGGGSSSSGGSSSWSSGSSYKPSSSWSSGSSYKPSSSWSSGSSYKPSSSWNTGSSSSSGSSWSKPSTFDFNVPKTPSSWGSSSSSGSHGYPSSTGLSGSNSGSHKYPSSSTGLSGSSSGSRGGSGSHSYPSGTGLSGSGSRYPSTGSGSHSYPSGTGLSGSGSRYPSSGSGSHSYPSGTGLSGSSKPVYSAPPHTWHTSSSSSGSTYYQPPIIHYPQHVYVTQYRDSGSRYGDLLTGLTLYNMGRSHSHHYHDHYYYDDYYRHRYYDNYNSNSGSSYRPTTQDRPKDEAVCNLRIVENGKIQLLKIPCEIVSTFAEDGKKVNAPVETIVNKTECTSNSTVITKNKPEIVKVEEKDPISLLNIPTTNSARDFVNYAKKITDEIMNNYTKITLPSVSQNGTTTATNTTPALNATALNTTALNMTSTENATTPVRIENNVTEGNKTVHTVRLITSTQEIINVTVCITSTTLNSTDPLKVKGGPIDTSGMECSVDIKTKDAYFRNNIDCNTLMQYAKKPLTAPKQNALMPEREKLKQWLNKPPWWMSMFIAV